MAGDTEMQQRHRSMDEYLSAAASGRTPGRYWILFLSLGVGLSSDASEILSLSYILSDEDFLESILDQHRENGGLLAATVFLGMLLGGLLVGTLGDRYGRKPLLLTGLSTNATAGLLAALAWNAPLLGLCRFVAGIGIGATIPPLFTLGSELSPPADRGFWITVVASFWMVGSIYVAVIAWLLQGFSWRLLAAFSALPCLSGTILCARLVPESPRFLALRGDYSQAAREVVKLADAMGYEGPPLSVDELMAHYPEREVVSPRSLRGIAGLQMALAGFLASTQQLYSPSIRKTTLPLQMAWFALSFGTYGLYTWINTIFVEVKLENVYFNALLFALSNLPGNILSALLLDRVGRGAVLSGCLLTAAASLFVFAYGASTMSPVWVVVTSCAFQGFSTAAWNSIDVLSSELFATTIRSTGMGVCTATGRIGAMLAQLVNGYLVGSPARLLSVAASSLLLGALTPAFLPTSLSGQAVPDRLESMMEPTDESLPFPSHMYEAVGSAEPSPRLT